MSELSISISVHNRQRAIKLDVAQLQAFAERALSDVAETEGTALVRKSTWFSYRTNA